MLNPLKGCLLPLESMTNYIRKLTCLCVCACLCVCVCVCVSVLTCVGAQLCLTLGNSMDYRLWGLLSMGFLRQEYWCGLLFPSPRDLPDPGVEPESAVSPALAGGFFTTAPPRNGQHAWVPGTYFRILSGHSPIPLSFTWPSSYTSNIQSFSILYSLMTLDIFSFTSHYE